MTSILNQLPTSIVSTTSSSTSSTSSTTSTTSSTCAACNSTASTNETKTIDSDYYTSMNTIEIIINTLQKYRNNKYYGPSLIVEHETGNSTEFEYVYNTDTNIILNEIEELYRQMKIINDYSDYNKILSIIFIIEDLINRLTTTITTLKFSSDYVGNLRPIYKEIIIFDSYGEFNYKTDNSVFYDLYYSDSIKFKSANKKLYFNATATNEKSNKVQIIQHELEYGDYSDYTAKKLDWTPYVKQLKTNIKSLRQGLLNNPLGLDYPFFVDTTTIGRYLNEGIYIFKQLKQYQTQIVVVKG
jgi:hypothetical protein